MDATLADLARHDTVRQGRAKLIARHHSDSMLHRSRIVIENLNPAYGPGQALKRGLHCGPTISNHRADRPIRMRYVQSAPGTEPHRRAADIVLLYGNNVVCEAVALRRLRRRVSLAFHRCISRNAAFGTRVHWHPCRANIASRLQTLPTRLARWDEIKDLLGEPASTAFHGQRQRLSIVRALSMWAESVLMNKPISALDPPGTDGLRRAVTIVSMTRTPRPAARYTDRAALFRLGEVIKAGSAGQMFVAPACPQTTRYVIGRFG